MRHFFLEAVSSSASEYDLSLVFFLHGTTVGLNALLEDSGPVVGLLATNGFRDVLNSGELNDSRSMTQRGKAPPRSCRGRCESRYVSERWRGRHYREAAPA